MTTIKEFHPGLFLTELQLPDFAVRGAVIIGAQRAIIWDSLSHPRDMQQAQALISASDWALVYSHADWDHVWGTAGLPHAGRTIIGHEHCLARFSHDVPLELNEKRMAQPGVWDEVVLVPPTMTFSQELSLDLGNLTLTLHHLPGHTRDCIVGFIPEWGILLAGDTVETPLPGINEDDSPVETWIAALQNWEQNDRVQHVIPSHGIIGGRELLRQNIVYLQNLRSGVPVELPEALDDFYRETHQNNIRFSLKKLPNM
jgi:glyoxylase-like metal-dependent hydrolase (beta-lactamase superfamily II)